jgi:hypothetical protein
MGGPKIEFVQKDDRLVLRNLSKVAADELATVVELAFEGEALHELGPGHKLISEV